MTVGQLAVAASSYVLAMQMLTIFAEQYAVIAELAIWRPTAGRCGTCEPATAPWSRFAVWTPRQPSVRP
jgi:hypothetical protein